MKFERSAELYGEAVKLMPGGVSSPVRAFKPHPFYVSNAKGSKLYDIDGNEFIDYCLCYGANILGHAFDYVKDKLHEQLEKGWLYCTPIGLEVKYAKLIKKFYPSIEMLRFVNSGSEATMAAIRVARGFNGRKKIVKIEGSFHGSHDAVLIKAGSGATTFGIPSSAGIPEEVTKNTIQIPFNDLEALSEVLEKEEVAAVIMEPVMGNAALIKPEESYLGEVRKITEENDALLIFDEIITGFRLAMGGAQEYYGVKADITTLGKIAGGGFPIGIYGGKKEIMELIAPSGNVYQAGTFSGNPMSLAAGYYTVEYVARNNVLNKVNKKTEELCRTVAEIAEGKVEFDWISSMFCVYFGGKPKNYVEALRFDKEAYMRFFWKMLKSGVFLPPSQFETCFLSYSHTDEDISRTIEAFSNAL